MATWGGHGLRGSTLEDMINRTNEAYRLKKLALIQKIPTPVTPVEINNKSQITLAYFDQKSTVDYIGVVQNIAVCFDAKETVSDTFPLQNVHEHQILFMRDFEAQGGVAFFILFFTSSNIMYYMKFSRMYYFWERMKNGGRKSFKRDELIEEIPIRHTGEFLCHYLEGLAEDISDR